MDGQSPEAPSSVQSAEGTSGVPAVPTPFRVLSGPNGDHPAGDAAAHVCLADMGTGLVLFIQEGHGLHEDVASYENRIERLGVRFHVQEVSYQRLLELNGGAAGAAAGAGGRDAEAVTQAVVLGHLQRAIQAGASDLHYHVWNEGWELKPRVNGDVREPMAGGSNDQGWKIVRSLYNSMLERGSADEALKEGQPQDGRLNREFSNRLNLFGARIATRPTSKGLYVAVRLLYSAGRRRNTMADYGYLPSQIEHFRRLTQSTKGSVALVVGATNSGKSTTLQKATQLVDEYFKGSRNIVTLEDPVEYDMPWAKQTPVNRDESGNADWNGGISNCMRLDPDVLVIGELRDRLSAQAAYRGGMTGHLVLGTLHVTDAPSTIQRLLDLEVEPSLVLDSRNTSFICAQSLVTVLCPKCAIPWNLARGRQDSGLVERVERMAHGRLGGVRVRGAGCESCGHTGIVDRTLLAETQVPSHAYMQVFKREGKAAAAAYWIGREKAVTKAAHALVRILEGTVDPAMAEATVGALDQDEEFIKEVQP